MAVQIDEVASGTMSPSPLGFAAIHPWDVIPRSVHKPAPPCESLLIFGKTAEKWADEPLGYQGLRAYS